jgi:hypothetical protein
MSMSVSERWAVLGWDEKNAEERISSVLGIKASQPEILKELVSCGTLSNDQRVDFNEIVSALGIVEKFAAEISLTEGQSFERRPTDYDHRGIGDSDFTQFQTYTTGVLEKIQPLTMCRELYKK